MLSRERLYRLMDNIQQLQILLDMQESINSGQEEFVESVEGHQNTPDIKRRSCKLGHIHDCSGTCAEEDKSITETPNEINITLKNSPNSCLKAK